MTEQTFGEWWPGGGCSCFKSMGNDFWFLPTGRCLQGECDNPPPPTKANEMTQGDSHENPKAATRAEVYAAIDSERKYQDEQQGNAVRHIGMPGRGTMHPAEFIVYMEKCLNDAREAVYRGGTGAVECLPFVRKVAALGVACMELHGAPLRK